MHEQDCFLYGLSVFILGMIVWIIRPRSRSGRNAIKFAGMEFSLGTPESVVMVLGVLLMVLSPAFPDYFGSPPVKPLVVCTGEFEDQLGQRSRDSSTWLSSHNGPSGHARRERTS
jgi:hypothetical protein